MLRRPLALCVLTCLYLIAHGVAAQAPSEQPSKVQAKPSPVRIKPGRLDKGAPDIPAQLSCQNLLVSVSIGSQSITITNVACDHGYDHGTLPSPPGSTARLLQQSPSFGPNCTLTLSNGGVFWVQQNYCYLEAGTVSAGVIQGNVSITRKVQGSYGQSQPGIVYASAN